MVFFGKNDAVIKIKGMCCFFVVLNVAIVVVGVIKLKKIKRRKEKKGDSYQSQWEVNIEHIMA